MDKYIDWDSFFMSMVYMVATKSKDNSTHIGAVIVGPNNEIVSTGYNSFPRGIDDYVSERQERPEKYYWLEHAERNALYNAALIGVSTRGCRMYTNGIPCMDCARGIVQCGIKEVIVDKKWNDDNYAQWVEHADRATVMFKEAGVKLRLCEFELIKVNKFKQGSIFDG